MLKGKLISSTFIYSLTQSLSFFFFLLNVHALCLLNCYVPPKYNSNTIVNKKKLCEYVRTILLLIHYSNMSNKINIF